MSFIAKSRIPVTVLTGYLGSGKTTLLNRILTHKDRARVAVIVNEFGEVGIDSKLVVQADEQILEMNNGCVVESSSLTRALVVGCGSDGASGGLRHRRSSCLSFARDTRASCSAGGFFPVGSSINSFAGDIALEIHE
jgi:hypothetical protein